MSFPNHVFFCPSNEAEGAVEAMTYLKSFANVYQAEANTAINNEKQRKLQHLQTVSQGAQKCRVVVMVPRQLGRHARNSIQTASVVGRGVYEAIELASQLGLYTYVLSKAVDGFSWCFYRVRSFNRHDSDFKKWGQIMLDVDSKGPMEIFHYPVPPSRSAIENTAREFFNEDINFHPASTGRSEIVAPPPPIKLSLGACMRYLRRR